MNPVRKTPFRSPRAISEYFADLVKDKVFCDLGCAEGDNLVFFSKFAKKVMGIDSDKKRLSAAQERGLNVWFADYFNDDIPDADVYYIWPNNCKDLLPLSRRMKKINKTGKLLLASDYTVLGDVLKDCVDEFKADVVEIPFNEGKRHRQSGVFRVAVIDL